MKSRFGTMSDAQELRDGRPHVVRAAPGHTGAGSAIMAGALRRTAQSSALPEAGRAEAIGTHAELLAQGGRYADLFELQAAGYR